MLDLLHAAAQVLVVGGSLCYLIPTPYDFVSTVSVSVHVHVHVSLSLSLTLTTHHSPLTMRPAQVAEDLPRHPCFSLEHMCVQNLSTRHGRTAVQLRKVRPYCAELRAEFAAYCSEVLQGRDVHFGLLIGKLERALAPAAHDDAAVVKRKSAAFEKRRASKNKRLARKHEEHGADADAGAEVEAEAGAEVERGEEA